MIDGILLETNRCSLKTIENLVKDPSLVHGLDIVSQRISTISDEEDAVLIGSYIQFICADGFSNKDGNLNVSCTSDGQWSSFPICVSHDATRTSGRCLWENDPLPSVSNSYRSNADNLRVFSNGQASGYYDIDCDPGYALDSTIGARITCLESGQWSSPLPKCNCMSENRTRSVKDKSSLFFSL